MRRAIPLTAQLREEDALEDKDWTSDWTVSPKLQELPESCGHKDTRTYV